MTDEQQAAEYRRMMLARTRAKAARERALAGSRSARLDLQAGWQPLIDWYAERDSDGGEDDPPEDTGQIFNLNPGLEV